MTSKVVRQRRNWRKYTFEFLSIFAAVVSAFALNNWSENQRDSQAANKILTEISNGLVKDLDDIKGNIKGHENGIRACQFWRKIIRNEDVKQDSLAWRYLTLTRNFFSAQNVSGYETLKSKGLELIKNDSLRFNIISLYEYDFRALKMLEEEYFEMQYQANYFKDINTAIAPYFEFDAAGTITSIKTPLRLTPAERNILLSYLWKIETNRSFILRFYVDMEKKINELNGRLLRERRG